MATWQAIGVASHTPTRASYPSICTWIEYEKDETISRLPECNIVTSSNNLFFFLLVEKLFMNQSIWLSINIDRFMD